MLLHNIFSDGKLKLIRVKIYCYDISTQKLIFVVLIPYVNPFDATDLFPYFLKPHKNQRFSDFFQWLLKMNSGIANISSKKMFFS